MISRNFNPFNDVVKEAPTSGHSTIKDLAKADRPREKMLAKGAEALTNAELLAVIVGGGNEEKNAVELMESILHDCEDKLLLLNKMRIEDLMKYRGIGEVKALCIQAVAELGRRRSEETIHDIKAFENGAVVMDYMRPKIQDLTHEEAWALLLNNNARLIRCVHLSSGGLTETSVDIRMLFREACLANATCFILVHNHPSGSLRPSRADEELTWHVQKAGVTMNIRLLDHVIVTDGDYYSFSENGKI